MSTTNSAAIARQALETLSQLPSIRHPKIIPSAAALAHAFEMVFWSSLDSYEGTPISAKVFFAPQAAIESSGGAFRLGQPKLLNVENIRRLAPAHGARGGLLVIEHRDGSLSIEGLLGRMPFFREVSPLWLSVERRGVGAVRINCGHTPILDFRKGAVRRLGGLAFDRTSAELLLMGAGIFPEQDTTQSWRVASALIDVAFAIEDLGTGGALWLLHPSKRESSEVRGMGNSVRLSAESWAPYQELWEQRTSVSRLLNTPCNLGHEFLQQAAQEWDLMRRASLSGSIADLSRVDGAILVTTAPELIEFGVICNRFSAPAQTVLQSNNSMRPLEGQPVDASAFGGSRHRSAIDFCSSNHPASALVASHDGGVTAFSSLEVGTVVGSRVSPIPSEPDVNQVATSGREGTS